MYRNFLTAMKDEGVTFAQIGSLLGCRYQTVSDTVNGETKRASIMRMQRRFEMSYFQSTI